MLDFFNNKKGSAVIVIVFLALMGFFALTLLASDVIKSNLIMSKAQLNSTKAYFAAEVGLEHALWRVMKNDYELPENTTDNVFENTNVGEINSFLNNGVYSVNYNRSNSIRTFVSTGGYSTEHRSTEVSFCIPDCFEKDCGTDDGCDNVCPSTCESDIGCRVYSSSLVDALEVENSEGSCCGTQKCYVCRDGFIWDGTSCVYDCVQQCEGLGCGDLDPNCNLPCPGECATNPGCVPNGTTIPGTVVSPGGSCCDIAGTEYTCYECSPGFGWDGSGCVACSSVPGDPYPGSDFCYDAGVHDCFGNQVEPTEQIAKGSPCEAGAEAQVSLSMNEGTGVVTYDSTDNNNDAVFQGNEWTYRKEIKIDHTKFPLDLIDFQFLLRLDSDLGLFYRALDNGDDIVFRDVFGNKIPHEIEYFNGTTVNPTSEMGRLIVWLRIPQIYSAQDTKIYMYYGNPLSGNQQNKTEVWKEYKGVWHLNNNLDSSPSAANITWGGLGAWSSTVASQVYSGINSIVSLYNYYGMGTFYLNSGSAATLDDTTISAWVKPSNQLWSTNWLFNMNHQWYWPTAYGQGLFFSGNTPSFSGTTNLSSGRNLNDGNWHHIAYVVKDAPGVCYFYVDGEIVSTGINCYGVAPTNIDGWSTSLHGDMLGHPFYGSGPWPSYGNTNFVGTSDEIRFAYYPFSSDYIKVSYQNQLSPTTYIKSIGAEEGLGGGLANWVPSIYHTALEFNGSSNYLGFATGATIPLNGNMTLEAWVYPSTQGANMEIASKWGDSWGWYLNNSNRQCLYLRRSNTTTVPYACSTVAVGLNTWTHLAVAFNKSGNQVIFYNNGVASAPVAVASLNQGTLGSFVISGTHVFTSHTGSNSVSALRFRGRIDEFRAYDYVRSAIQVQYDANKNICDGEGACAVLSSPLNNSGTYQTCDDICHADDKVCSSVGTDSAGTNGLMSVDNGGVCASFAADCSTTIRRNPEAATPNLCSGPDTAIFNQTNWTNCNCSICDLNFGAACAGNSCLVPDTGITACDGTCADPTYISAGTPCGTNRECDGLGQCRSVCHPLIGQPCGADQCNNPGVVSCDGFCEGIVEKPDNSGCVNDPDDAFTDQCQGGICTMCVANLGQPCNVGECLDAGVIDCFGGCSACTGGDCATNPNYANEGDSCNSGYGADTGTCDASGVCVPCHPNYLNFGATCPAVACRSTVTRDCETGVCPTGSLLPVNSYCTNLGLPGACTSTGTCTVCQPGYMDPCNVGICRRVGTVMCDGLTCSTSGYLNTGDSCNAGLPTNWAYPNTGYCNASHACITCSSGYLNQEQCNDAPCQVPGDYLCDGGCDACISGDCVTNPEIMSNGSTCDTGAATTQPYSGTCQGGACQQCAQGFLDNADCNTAVCHKVGKVKCDGTCSTGTSLEDEGAECDGGIYNGYPGRDTGSCDASGNCDTCNWYYIYDQPCTPSTGDTECWNIGKVTTCQGTCNSTPKVVGTTCNVDSITSTLPYTGKCDGAGNCNVCDSLYINQTPCNNEPCHVPSTYNCEGTCLGSSFYLPPTFCNAGPAYATSPRYPNTGQCGGNIWTYTADGVCTACNADYLSNSTCYPTGVTLANQACYIPQTVTTCYGICPTIYVGAGLPCGGGNECNGAGVCTTPLETVVALNRKSGHSCDYLCSHSPYVGRGCVDVGTNAAATDNTAWLHSPSWAKYAATCATVIPYTEIFNDWTNCLCGNCVSNYGLSCRTEDSCNYAMTTQCNGDCPTSYKANNLFCDPAGVNPNGYCFSGACLECTQVPGSPCNTGECYNQGTYNCQGVCSTAANPYKTSGISCSGGGVCDGAGVCVIPSPLFGQPCPYIPPKDSECYNSGTWNFDGTACVSTSIKNNNAVCTTNTGTEGRCSAGNCNACSTLYNQDCPVNSPYNAYCYNAGKYDCFGTCVGSYIKNNGLSGCGTPSYICYDGVCVIGSEGVVYYNRATEKSCDQICTENSFYCFSVGTNSIADNGAMYTSTTDKDNNVTCNTTGATCSTVMTSLGSTCSGYLTNWTNCKCTNCNTKAWQSCETDPMYDGLNYDSECFNFGTYDCDGTCINTGVINNNGVCTNNSTAIEGRCSSGVCNQCVSSYINNELCTPNSCATFVRECNGDCSGAINLGVGETCGVGLECTVAGACVPASSLPDIVVPNFATGQSCNNICASYPDRTCESIGTDGTQAGGTNGKGMYYGLVNENPACVSQNSFCSTIFSRSPSSTSSPFYGYTCSETLTDWTYCRCTNQ